MKTLERRPFGRRRWVIHLMKYYPFAVMHIGYGLCMCDINLELNRTARLISKCPWWRRDKLGWPIETVKGRPGQNLGRILLQNLRKLIN